MDGGVSKAWVKDEQNVDGRGMNHFTYVCMHTRHAPETTEARNDAVSPSGRERSAVVW